MLHNPCSNTPPSNPGRLYSKCERTACHRDPEKNQLDLPPGLAQYPLEIGSKSHNHLVRSRWIYQERHNPSAKTKLADATLDLHVYNLLREMI
jgi:hypothetical protein